MSDRIGITTTVPVEVIYAAGHRPVDMNNRFIGHADPHKLLEQAQRDGFAPGVCAWIKGLYAVALSHQIDRVVAVVHGDCANTVALGEVLRHRGVPVVDFAFPHDRDPLQIARAIDAFADKLGANATDVATWKERLDRIRKKLLLLDELTWSTGQVTGQENHRYLVASSDFNGDPDAFESEVDAFLKEAQARPEAIDDAVRIGVLGVPTALTDLYFALASRGARVLYNEVQRQFAMLSLQPDLPAQYAQYTYPFDLRFRIQDIRRQIARRKITGLVHYIQSFCHRQIEDIVIRESVGIPVLSIEGDRPGPVDGRTLTRIDAFLEMLRGMRTENLQDRLAGMPEKPR